MGFIAALAITEGIRKFIMKLLLLTTLAAVAVAQPSYYPHQQTWPGIYGPGYSALCYGCRHKRSAEADPQELVLAAHPIHPKAIYPTPSHLPANWGAPALSYTLRVPPPAPAALAKREAEAEAEAEAKADPAYLLAHPFYHPYGLIPPLAVPAVPTVAAIVPVDLAGDGRGTHPNGGQVYNAPMTWPGK